MTEQAGGTLVAPLPAEPSCDVAWCKSDHKAYKRGDQYIEHVREFDGRTIAGGGKVRIIARWQEPLIRPVDDWIPPTVTIVMHDDPTSEWPPSTELEPHDLKVLARCSAATGGDGWFAQTLMRVADELDRGTPDVEERAVFVARVPGDDE